MDFELRFGWVPPSKNTYDGWSRPHQASGKRRCVDAVGWWVKALQIPRCEVVWLHARLLFPVVRRRDPQNYTVLLGNWIPDALVTFRVLPDDDHGRVRLLGDTFGVDFARAPKKQTIVTVRT